MFKKTRVREILEMLCKDLSERDISQTLRVSRNSVARIRIGSERSGRTTDELLAMNDDDLYHLFYPGKFRRQRNYTPVDYAYVHKELAKTGVTETLLWEEYRDKCVEQGLKYCSYATFARDYKNYSDAKSYTSHVIHKPGVKLEVDWAGSTTSFVDPDIEGIRTAYLFVATFPYSQYTYVEAAASMNQGDWITCNVHMLEYFGGSPVQIVCDNLKTGVIKHPRHGEIVLNEEYLSFAEHYQVAILPAGVKKPKHKPSVEGSVDKIADKIIGMLRNETFYSIDGLNRGIRQALDKLNSKAFQKREGSRKLVFETEEKPFLRNLPLIPFEACEWSYHHKVGSNSHIWLKKGLYSVPNRYINKYVDVQYNNSMVYIYYSHDQIAEHKRIPAGMKNARRTDESHLPYPVYSPETIESTMTRAGNIGKSTRTVVERLYENAKVKEQALIDARAVLDIAGVYSEEVLEKACEKALRDFHLITYNTLIPYVKSISGAASANKHRETRSKGIVRGADYYRKDTKEA